MRIVDASLRRLLITRETVKLLIRSYVRIFTEMCKGNKRACAMN